VKWELNSEEMIFLTMTKIILRLTCKMLKGEQNQQQKEVVRNVDEMQTRCQWKQNKEENQELWLIKKTDKEHLIKKQFNPLKIKMELIHKIINRVNNSGKRKRPDSHINRTVVYLGKLTQTNYNKTCIF
jgi:ribosomal protein L22